MRKDDDMEVDWIKRNRNKTVITVPLVAVAECPEGNERKAA